MSENHSLTSTQIHQKITLAQKNKSNKLLILELLIKFLNTGFGKSA